jgi:hypothetical protein
MCLSSRNLRIPAERAGQFRSTPIAREDKTMEYCSQMFKL